MQGTGNVRGMTRLISTRYFVSQFPGQCSTYIYIVAVLLYSKEGPVMHKFQSETTEATHTGGLTILESIAPSRTHGADGLRGPRHRSCCLVRAGGSLPGTSQNISPGLHYTIILYVLPYIYYDHTGLQMVLGDFI